MFTQNTERLSSFAGSAGLRIVRDCEFSYVGKIPTLLPCRIVACATARHIDEARSGAGIVGIITIAELQELVPLAMGLAISDKPLSATFDIHDMLCQREGFHWQRFETIVAPDAVIHPSAMVAPYDVVVGAGSVVSERAIVCERAVIGEACRVGPGTVVGSRAFEVRSDSQPHRILSQAGGVQIASHVEILANCTIARATFGGFTSIGEGSKIDCLVHVAHDCQIGRRVNVAACAEISGRVVVGDDVFIGPNVTISNGISIGQGATVTLGSVVVRDVPVASRVTGNFALPHEKWLSFIRSIR